MILEQNKEKIQTYGDVQQNKVSIDPRNAEHIISILSSNLYSNPEESFLRETISNAVDSHKEAGTTDPIILLFKANGSKFDIVVRDYGTGISPERFDKIYRYIGNSTKRDSNAYIGSFGIGRFSALAVANVVYITSYYNGIANSYVMAKNGGGIDIDLVSSLETDERNGVEIRVQVDTVSGYDKILTNLCYISNLYVECQGFNDSYYSGWSTLCNAVNRFNSRKIIDFGEFKHNTFITDNYYYGTGRIVLGNIVYPIEFGNITPLPNYPRLTKNDISDILKDANVTFSIGSLDITPNREALLYSERTIKALREAYTKVFDYLQDEYAKQAENNTNIIEYYNQIRQSRSIVLTKDDVTIKINIPREISNSEYKFKGKVVDKKTLEKIDNIFCHSISQFPIAFILDEKGVLNTYRKNKLDIRNILYEKRYGRNYNPNDIQIIKIGSREATKSVLLRSYTANKYAVHVSNTYRIFIPNYTFKDIINWFLTTAYAFKEFDNATKTYTINETKSIWLLKELIRALSPYVIEDDIENSEEFKTWKENRKLAAKANTQVVAEKPILGYVEYDDTIRKLEFKTLAEFEHQLKFCTCLEEKERALPVIYGEMHSPYWEIFDKLITYNSKQRFLIVKTAKNNMKYFKNISSKWIYIEDYIPKMKEFRQFLTYRKYRKDNPSLFSSTSDYNEEYKAAKNLLDSITFYIVEEDKKAIKMCIDYKLPSFRSEDCEALNTLLVKYKETSKVPYDYEFMYALRVYDKYMKLASKVKNSYYKFKKYFYSSPGIAFTYFLMKNKLLRMNFSQYKDLVQTFKIKVE